MSRRQWRYAIVEIPRVGKTAHVRGLFQSLHEADETLRCGQELMQVAIRALLGDEDAAERVHAAVDALEDGRVSSLPSNVVRLESAGHSSDLEALVAAETILRSAVIASRDLEIGLELCRNKVFQLAFRANALRAARKGMRS